MTATSLFRPRRVVNRRRPPVHTGAYDVPRPKRLTRKERRHRRRLLRELNAVILDYRRPVEEHKEALRLRLGFHAPTLPVGLQYAVVKQCVGWWSAHRPAPTP